MKSHMDGTHKEMILGQYSPGSRYNGRFSRAAPDCNCPQISTSSVFAMDHSKTADGEMYFVDKTTSNIMASDLSGCNCRIVVNATGMYGQLG